MWYSTKLFFARLGWMIVFGLAWVFCVVEDHIWSPVWWYFNKHKYTRKD